MHTYTCIHSHEHTPTLHTPYTQTHTQIEHVVSVVGQSGFGMMGAGLRDQPTACGFSVPPPVALNFQTPGPEMDVYLGRFQDNGACGYVLKPAFMRDPSTTFNARSLTQGPWWAPKRLRVRVQPDTGGSLWGVPSCSLPSLIDHCLHLFLDHFWAAAAKSQQE